MTPAPAATDTVAETATTAPIRTATGPHFRSTEAPDPSQKEQAP